MEPGKLRSLFEAARWAPSSNNEQPWRFLVATRVDAKGFAFMLECLVEANRAWAESADVLALTCTRLTWERNGLANRHAFHDAGLALENLLLQAVALDLIAHPMAGFSPDKARELFAIPEGFEAVTAVAIGYPGDVAKLPDKLRQKALRERTRRPLESLVFSGRWGDPAFGTSAPTP